MNADPREAAAKRPDLLTVDEVAFFLRISKTGVYRIVERRALPFYRVGGVLRFDRKAVDEYLRRAHVGSVHELAHGL